VNILTPRRDLNTTGDWFKAGECQPEAESVWPGTSNVTDIDDLLTVSRLHFVYRKYKNLSGGKRLIGEEDNRACN
jgi:hypothetical protein